MPRLIDADVLLDELLKRQYSAQSMGIFHTEYPHMRGIVAKQPTIDPESLRPQGRWVDNHCTACGKTPLGEELWEHLDVEPPRFELCFPICPNCGAKMDEEET